MGRPAVLLCMATVICSAVAKAVAPTVIVEDAGFWRKLGQAELQAALERKPNTGVAKNVILFVGDGMGVSTVTAGRIYKGQKKGHPGEEEYLSFEKFPYTAMIKTYAVNRQVSDSAATATALLTGVKTNQETLGLDATATTNVCDKSIIKQASLDSIAYWAQTQGKDTGLVTNTRVTHATPASLYANSPHRNWECDSKIPVSERNKGCKDIASQLIEDEPGRNLKVILGGGQLQLRGDTEAQSSDSSCRLDKRDLVKEWKEVQANKGFSYKYVTNSGELHALDVEKTDCVLGLFAAGNMPYEVDRSKTAEGQPSLANMTYTAVRMLRKNKNGFFLLVEGGLIDYAHHYNLAKKAMEEVLSFDEAVRTAIENTNPQDTLIVVTSDHSHVFTVNGYPSRGNNILGFAGEYPDGGTLPYTTLSYTNGPGFHYHRDSNSSYGWKNLSDVNTFGNNFQMLATVPQEYETHGGEDVASYAKGPMAHLLQGVHEQSYIAWVMSYASCIGPAAANCHTAKKVKSVDNSAGGPHLSSLLFSVTYIWLLYKYFSTDYSISVTNFFS